MAVSVLFSWLTEFDPTGCSNAKLVYTALSDVNMVWTNIQDMVRKQWEMWTPLKQSEYFYKMEFLLELFPHFTGLLCPGIHVIRCLHLLSYNGCHKISS